ncbi:hypothetical protein HOY80DRAFT_916331 [Tuber brumale]|nr:hypothetical protein HOY80DRAFT_916331 [Tuber brumale]
MSEKYTSSAASTASTSTTSTIKSAFQKLLPKTSSSPGRDSSTEVAGTDPAEEKTRALETRVAYLAHRS